MTNLCDFHFHIIFVIQVYLYINQKSDFVDEAYNMIGLLNDFLNLIMANSFSYLLVVIVNERMRIIENEKNTTN